VHTGATAAVSRTSTPESRRLARTHGHARAASSRHAMPHSPPPPSRTPPAASRLRLGQNTSTRPEVLQQTAPLSECHQFLPGVREFCGSADGVDHRDSACAARGARARRKRRSKAADPAAPDCACCLRVTVRSTDAHVAPRHRSRSRRSLRSMKPSSIFVGLARVQRENWSFLTILMGGHRLFTVWCAQLTLTRAQVSPRGNRPHDCAQ
jgi:hypothetical protein